MIRDKFIQVRATEDELQEIKSGSKKASIPTASFVRACAIKESRKLLQEANQN